MFVKRMNNKLLINKISCLNYSHHVKIHVDKTKNRSDNQDKDKIFPQDTSLKHKRIDYEHKFDEVFTKGRGGNMYLHRDKEGLYDNFNEILNRTISAPKPYAYELNKKNIENIESDLGSKLNNKFSDFSTEEALSKHKKEK